MYADETTIITTDKSIVKTIYAANSDMVNVLEWFLTNKLS